MPRRTSNQMKVLRGTDKPSRTRDEVSFSAPETMPDPPAWVTDTVAIQEWEARVPDLMEAGVVSNAALTVLAMYVNQVASIAAKYARGEDPTAAELTQCRLYATEFGFTPASRSKAGTTVKRDENKFSAFSAKKSG